MDPLDELRQRTHEFAAVRDWEQFHSPKNLAMALAGEVGELVSELQWLTDAQVSADLAAPQGIRERLTDEVADVFIYLLRFAEVADIDLLAAAGRKMDANETRYPAALAHGSAKKYNQLTQTPLAPQREIMPEP